MALANYTDLQAAIGTWSFNRTDLPATDLIALAETRLNRDLKLRVAESDEELTGVVDSRLIALPATFAYVVDVWREDTEGRCRLQRLVPGLETSNTAGNPAFWAIEGTNLAFERPCGDTYTFTIRCGLKFSLSDASPTNWLLSYHPDAYLAASLVEAALWMEDDAQASRWEARYQAALQAIRTLEAASRRAPLRCDELVHQRDFDIITGDGLGAGVPIYI